jgi:hypothetical protein
MRVRMLVLSGGFYPLTRVFFEASGDFGGLENIVVLKGMAAGTEYKY